MNEVLFFNYYLKFRSCTILGRLDWSRITDISINVFGFVLNAGRQNDSLTWSIYQSIEYNMLEDLDHQQHGCSGGKHCVIQRIVSRGVHSGDAGSLQGRSVCDLYM